MDSFLIFLQIFGFIVTALSAWLTVVMWRQGNDKKQLEHRE
jgi:hypothetical protein